MDTVRGNLPKESRFVGWFKRIDGLLITLKKTHQFGVFLLIRKLAVPSDSAHQIKEPPHKFAGVIVTGKQIGRAHV